jgi:hypothetical protein
MNKFKKYRRLYRAWRIFSGGISTIYRLFQIHKLISLKAASFLWIHDLWDLFTDCFKE